MRLLLLASKTEAAPLLSILHQERIYYDLLGRIAFMDHPPFSKRIYNGVLIEEKLIKQCSLDDLATLELLKKVLPCQAVFSDPDPSQLKMLAAFFEACQRFPPRSIRKQSRTQLCLPAKLSTDAGFSDPQTTNTFNLSQNGCFLTHHLNQKIGDKIWLCLDGLEDAQPLLSEIRWVSQGTTTELPLGAGVRFLEASLRQRQQLDSLIHKK